MGRMPYKYLPECMSGNFSKPQCQALNGKNLIQSFKMSVLY
jgi:hypothetical protein